MVSRRLCIVKYGGSCSKGARRTCNASELGSIPIPSTTSLDRIAGAYAGLKNQRSPFDSESRHLPDSSNGRAASLHGVCGGSIPSSGTREIKWEKNIR